MSTLGLDESSQNNHVCSLPPSISCSALPPSLRQRVTLQPRVVLRSVILLTQPLVYRDYSHHIWVSTAITELLCSEKPADVAAPI